MKLCEIGNIRHLIAGTKVESLIYINYEVDSIDKSTWMTIEEQIRIILGQEDGYWLAWKICSELHHARTLGIIMDCPAARLKPAHIDMSQDLFHEIMKKFTLMERNMICFTLATNLTLEEVAQLEHGDIPPLLKHYKGERLTLLERIIDQTPEIIFDNYVFWDIEWELYERVPMSYMPDKFRRTMFYEWAWFTRLLDRAISFEAEEKEQQLNDLLSPYLLAMPSPLTNEQPTPVE